MASARLRLHGGRHHVLASLGYVAQQVAQEVHPAEAVLPSAPLGATPGAALKHALDRHREPQVGVRDHQPSASQVTLLKASQKLTSESLGLAVAHGDAEHLPVAEGIDADRHHHRPEDHLQVVAQAAVEGSHIEVDVGKWACSKGLPRKALPCSSRPWQMRLTSDLEMPLSPPRASNRASTLRVEMPPVYATMTTA